MTNHRIIGHSALRDEMMAIAQGEKPAPADAGEQSFESVEALMRLLTPENRKLLAIIRDRKSRSIAELATFSGRAAPNLTRTLAKLVAVDFVRMEEDAKRRVPTAVVQKLHVEIDPFSLLLLCHNARMTIDSVCFFRSCIHRNMQGNHKLTSFMT